MPRRPPPPFLANAETGRCSREEAVAIKAIHAAAMGGEGGRAALRAAVYRKNWYTVLTAARQLQEQGGGAVSSDAALVSAAAAGLYVWRANEDETNFLVDHPDGLREALARGIVTAGDLDGRGVPEAIVSQTRPCGALVRTMLEAGCAFPPWLIAQCGSGEAAEALIEAGMVDLSAPVPEQHRIASDEPRLLLSLFLMLRRRRNWNWDPALSVIRHARDRFPAALLDKVSPGRGGGTCLHVLAGGGAPEEMMEEILEAVPDEALTAVDAEGRTPRERLPHLVAHTLGMLSDIRRALGEVHPDEREPGALAAVRLGDLQTLLDDLEMRPSYGPGVPDACRKRPRLEAPPAATVADPAERPAFLQAHRRAFMAELRTALGEANNAGVVPVRIGDIQAAVDAMEAKLEG
eukprot:jgi/Tetstr1/453914/TSEL_040833.t1